MPRPRPRPSLVHAPPNLEPLIRTYGRPELLRDSAALLGRLRAALHPDVRHVVRILDETGCGLDQEALLLTPGGARAHP